LSLNLGRIRQLRDVILKRVGEQRRARLSELELQTKYLVTAIWSASGNAKRGQPQKAAEQVKFLPPERKRRPIPTVGQVLRMFPSD
jgi:hypothetical protein